MKISPFVSISVTETAYYTFRTLYINVMRGYLHHEKVHAIRKFTLSIEDWYHKALLASRASRAFQEKEILAMREQKSDVQT